MKDEALFHYRDYIKSEHWEARKRKYYEVHEKKCAVCGHPDVDLHHIKYGHYGSEPDSALVPLCRVHHEELHDEIGVRKDTRYQSRYFIEEAKQKWQSRFSARDVALMPVSTPMSKKSDRPRAANLIDMLARPIWKLFDKLGL